MLWVLVAFSTVALIGLYWGYIHLCDRLEKRGKYLGMAGLTLLLIGAYALAGYISNHVFG